MGKKVSASVRVDAAASGGIYAQMLAGATQPISVREIIAVTRTAVVTNIALARSFSMGTASAGNVATGHAHRTPNQATVVGSVEIGWGTNPTGPTGAHSYIRRQICGASRTIDAILSNAATGVEHTLWSHDDDPIVIEPTGMTGVGLLILNVGSGAGAALDIHMTWEHGPASDR